jgi:hypothetical protein
MFRKNVEADNVYTLYKEVKKLGTCYLSLYSFNMNFLQMFKNQHHISH